MNKFEFVFKIQQRLNDISVKITRFEDILAWQEARKMVRLVYEAINANELFKKDFRLVGQIQAAAVSSMSNIAEGFTRKGKREFIQHLFISKGSAAEVQSQLYVALDQNYIAKDKFDEIYNQAERVARMDSAFIKYLNSQLKQASHPKEPNEPNEPKQLNEPK